MRIGVRTIGYYNGNSRFSETCSHAPKSLWEFIYRKYLQTYYDFRISYFHLWGPVFVKKVQWACCKVLTELSNTIETIEMNYKSSDYC
jgi:hypothetical protein